MGLVEISQHRKHFSMTLFWLKGSDDDAESLDLYFH